MTRYKAVAMAAQRAADSMGNYRAALAVQLDDYNRPAQQTGRPSNEPANKEAEAKTRK